MKILSELDYKTIEELISLNQKQVKSFLSKTVRKCYDKNNVKETKDFIIAEGNIPIALVAHMDTVFEHKRNKYNPGNMFYDSKKGVLWHNRGAGFDDRAGIFAILKILESGYRPHLIFTTDEEIGGVGADALVKKYPKCPFKNIKYLIELDRQGSNDCVFYDCVNEDFINYVESFGFKEDFGSFSDIDVICSSWGVAGTNLSIGYYDEHTTSEILRVNRTFDTIKKVKKMLMDAVNVDFFKYVPATYENLYHKYSFLTDDVYEFCDKCHMPVEDYNLIPIKTKDGTFKVYCIDCLDENARWCIKCNCAYEYDYKSKEMSEDLCRDCFNKESK